MHITSLISPRTVSRHASQRRRHSTHRTSNDSLRSTSQCTASPIRYSTDGHIDDRLIWDAVGMSDITATSECTNCSGKRFSNASHCKSKDNKTILRPSSQVHRRRSSSLMRNSAIPRSPRSIDPYSEPPRRFLSYAFVWTAPTMSGFLVPVRDGALAALNAAVITGNQVAPSSPSLRTSIERDILSSTMRAPRECVAVLIWLWKVDSRADFYANLRRHAKYVLAWRSTVGDNRKAVAALQSGSAAFNLLELAENIDGTLWRRSDYNGLRAIASRTFDFRPELASENLGTRATTAERGQSVSCAAMVVLLELCDIVLGSKQAAEIDFLVQYVMDIYCTYALRVAALVLNGNISDSPWRASSGKTCTASREEKVLDCLGISGEVPSGFRGRIKIELRASQTAAQHHVDGTKPKEVLSDADRSSELFDLIRTENKHLQLLSCPDGGDPMLVMSRHTSWQNLDFAGALDVRAIKRNMDWFTMFAVSKEDLEVPRNAALGIDVARADRKAARLWCSADEVRYPKLGVTRGIRNAEDMKRYLHVSSLETYIALSNQHAVWADASEVGYARRAWNGPIQIEQGLPALLAMQHLIFVPVGCDAVFNVLDWELKIVRNAGNGRLKIDRRTRISIDGASDVGNGVFTVGRKEVYL